MGPNWQQLGTYLGLRYNSLQAIDADHHKTRDKALHMLMEWKQRLPHGADGYTQLSCALEQCGRVDLAHRVASEFYYSLDFRPGNTFTPYKDIDLQ